MNKSLQTYLVSRVADHRSLPGSTSRHRLTSGVGHHVGDPVAILLVVPFFGFLGLWVGDDLRLVDKPILGNRSSLVDNGGGGGLVPIIRLY